MIFGKIFGSRTQKTHGKAADERPAPPAGIYATDEPWIRGDADRLNRGAYARRIAKTIVSNPALPSGIVIGVYGAWGEGKTSLLRMIESEFANESNIVPLWFNPWYFQRPDHLLGSYFAQLSDSIGVQLGTAAGEFKRVLTKYGALISPLPLAGGVGEAMTAVGEQIKEPDLEANKKRLDQILRSNQVRVVVFMDDIDRLDNAEIQTVMKLVKLTGGFPGVTYLLAFDDERVAAALGASYGGDAAAGRSFLDKIIQVALELPPADPLTVRQLAVEQIGRALELSEIRITPEEAEFFRNYFDRLFDARPRNLRTGKRLFNSLAFSLPLVRGEVAIQDFLLLETIRALCPEVYSALPKHRSLLLGLRAMIGEEARDEQKREWDALIELADTDDRKILAMALEEIFPRVQKYTKNMEYGNEYFDKWDSDRRAASENYFYRYFSYGVSATDVSDVAISDFVTLLSKGNVDACLAQYDVLLTPSNASRIIRKLLPHAKKLPATSAANLIRVFRGRAAQLPRTGDVIRQFEPQEQALLLLRELMRRIPQENRGDLSIEIIGFPTPLSFAAGIFQRFRHIPDAGDPSPRLLNEEQEADLTAAVHGRLEDEFEKQPYYLDRDSAGLLFFVWRLTAGGDDVRSRVGTRITNHPYESVQMVLSFSGRAVTIDSGVSSHYFERSNYEQIALYVDPDILATALEQFCASDETPQEIRVDAAFDSEDQRRVVSDFLAIHRLVVQQAADAAVAAGRENDAV